MARVTKAQVTRAHNAWGDCAARWGDDNIATMNALVRYHELRAAWESQTGRSYL